MPGGLADDYYKNLLGSGGESARYLQELRSGKNSLAQAQLQQGLGQAQLGLAAQSAASGANASSERAALYGGAQAMAQTNAEAAKLRASEYQAALGLNQAAIDSAAQNQLGRAQLEFQKQQYEEGKPNDFEQVLGGVNQVAGSMGKVAGLFSDRSRKDAIELLRAGKQDAALAALESMQPDRDRIAADQEEMDRYIDSRLRREGLDPARMGDADHERAAVRIMQTPGGRAWAPGKPVPADLEASLDAPGGGAPSVGTADAVARALDALGGKTDRELHDAVPRAPRAAADATLDGLDLYSYRYDKKAREMGSPPGERTGFMADELERTPLGAAAVRQTPDGKVVDRDQALGLALGLLGRVNEKADAALAGKRGGGAMVSDRERKEAVQVLGKDTVDAGLRAMTDAGNAMAAGGGQGGGGGNPVANVFRSIQNATATGVDGPRELARARVAGVTIPSALDRARVGGVERPPTALDEAQVGGVDAYGQPRQVVQQGKLVDVLPGGRGSIELSRELQRAEQERIEAGDLGSVGFHASSPWSKAARKVGMVSDRARKDAVAAVGRPAVDAALRELARTAEDEFTTGPGGEARFLAGQDRREGAVRGAAAGSRVALRYDPRDVENFEADVRNRVVTRAPREAEFTVGPDGLAQYDTERGPADMPTGVDPGARAAVAYRPDLDSTFYAQPRVVRPAPEPARVEGSYMAASQPSDWARTEAAAPRYLDMGGARYKVEGGQAEFAQPPSPAPAPSDWAQGEASAPRYLDMGGARYRTEGGQAEFARPAPAPSLESGLRADAEAERLARIRADALAALGGPR